MLPSFFHEAGKTAIPKSYTEMYSPVSCMEINANILSNCAQNQDQNQQYNDIPDSLAIFPFLFPQRVSPPNFWQGVCLGFFLFFVLNLEFYGAIA